MPEISVIVPVYKVEPYLYRCVDSILAQTFQDFELILVDDGSPDGCPAICDAYAQQDSRVHVIHQENSGLSAARNAGMDIATGKYMMFCDSDDYVSPGWIQAFVSAATSSHDNFIFGNIIPIGENQTLSDTMESEAAASLTLPVDQFLDLHIRHRAGFAWNVLYYADIIQKIGLRFRQDVIIEDLPFCLAYLKEMESLTYCGDAVYYYVQRRLPTLSRKYHQDGFRKWQEKYAMLQEFVDQKIPQQQQEESRKRLADYYLYFFLDSLNNTFDSRSTLSRIEKMRYNCKAVHSNEFQHCLQYTDGKREDPRYIWMLKNLPYPFAYGYIQCVKYKQNLSQKKPNSIKAENAYGPKKK